VDFGKIFQAARACRDATKTFVYLIVGRKEVMGVGKPISPKFTFFIFRV